MLEHFNDYISIGILLVIVIAFLYLVLSLALKGLEKSRIRKAMEKREKDQKGE